MTRGPGARASSLGLRCRPHSRADAGRHGNQCHCRDDPDRGAWGEPQTSHTSTYGAVGRKVCPSSLINFLRLRVISRAVSTVVTLGARDREIRRRQSHNNFKGHQVTKRLGILIAVIAVLVAGGLALGFGLTSNSNATAIKTTPAAHTATSTTTPPTTAPPTTVPPPPPTTTTVPPPPPTTTTVPPPPPPPTTTPPPPAVINGITQGNGGDHDPDNNGGPSDGDGNL